ncbi:MAG: sugar transferase [Patescibacteria group bacterium]|jgi:exopolysaccharide biosynthesis polyprenyl glycosylphosphotransferase
MKKSELTFSALLVPVDYFMVVAAGVLAYFLRFKSFLTDVRPVIYALPFPQYIKIVLVMAVCWLAIFAFSGLYKISGSRKFLGEFSRILLACSTATLTLIVIIFFGKQELFSSRFIIIAVWVVSILTVSFGRGLIRGVQRFLFTAGYGVNYIAVFGSDKTTEMIRQEIEKKPSIGLRVVKIFKQFNGEEKKAVQELLAQKKLDEVLQVDPNLPKEQILDLVDWCDEYHVTFKYAPDLFQAQATNVDISTLAGVPIIELRKTPLDGWAKIIKRFFDFILALFLLAVLFPVLAIIGIAIKIDSRGPVIYKNQRVSREGVFNTYKFRSMKTEYCTGPGYDSLKAEEYEKELIAEKNRRQGPVYKVLDDPRRTRVGRFLEKTSLDELPQIINVIIGNMSLVGPRPHQPREVEKYQRHHKAVLAIKPGITGLAQISGRSDLDFDEEVRLDTYYIENWSILLDLWILLRTPIVVLTRKSKV